MINIANTFLELREQRHAADYDHLAEFSKQEVLDLVDAARAAVTDLSRLGANESDSLARFLALTSLKTGIR